MGKKRNSNKKEANKKPRTYENFKKQRMKKTENDSGKKNARENKKERIQNIAKKYGIEDKENTKESRSKNIASVNDVEDSSKKSVDDLRAELKALKKKKADMQKQKELRKTQPKRSKNLRSKESLREELQRIKRNLKEERNEDKGEEAKLFGATMPFANFKNEKKDKYKYDKNYDLKDKKERELRKVNASLDEEEDFIFTEEERRERKKDRAKARREEKRKKAEELREREEEDRRLKERQIQKRKARGEKVSFREHTGWGKFFIIVRSTILVLILLAIIGIGLLFGLFNGYFDTSMKINKEDFVLSKQNSTVYDRDGKYIATLADDEKRKIVTLDEMSEYIPKAYVAIEDERFFTHHGVDIKRTAGATANYILKGDSSYGASTITQQLVKNMTKDDERDWKRKIREMAKATQIEKEFSKEYILELYLNLIFVGGDDIYGIALGSDYYFSKDPKDLKLAEAAFMAGINNRPNYYSPYIPTGRKDGKIVNEEEAEKYDKKMEIIKNRIKSVLNKMYELGYITEEEKQEGYAQADEGLKFKRGKSAASTVRYSHTVDAGIQELIQSFIDDPRKNMTRKMAELAVYSGGYKIYLTQDTDIQKNIQEEMSKKKYIFKSRKNPKATTEAISIIIDHKTGQVLGACGGLGDGVTMQKGDWNRVISTKRQTGSTMKPLGVVAPGLENGVLTAASVYDDTPFVRGNWRPMNFSKTFMGPVTMRNATMRSLNIPMLRAIEDIGFDESYDFLKKMDFQITEADKNYSGLALGGLNDGITVLEMAAGYAMIANDGEYIRPTFILRVENADGEEIFTPNQKKERMMSKQNAYILKDILDDTASTRAGATARLFNVSGFDSAGKTGSTNDNYDSWFCGFTNKYTGATWYGYDEVETINWRAFGVYDVATSLSNQIMNKIHKGLKGEKFEKPDGIEEITVCWDTGKRASNLCPRKHREVFAEGSVPDGVCDGHVSEEICSISGLLKSEFCKESDLTTRIFAKGKVPTKTCDQCEEKNRAEREKTASTLKKIQDAFAAISQVGTETSISKLQNAKSLYESASSDITSQLSAEIKNKYNRIDARIAELKKAEEDKKAKNAKTEANEVIGLIGALPEASTITTEEQAKAAKPSAQNARSKYNALSTAAKKEVSNIDRLNRLEAKINELD